LKDLWTAELPIGGEKSIGRGVLEGVRATIIDGEETFYLLDDFKNQDKAKALQAYVDALHNRENDAEYQERVNHYKFRKP
jgi:hypothetical protein